MKGRIQLLLVFALGYGVHMLVAWRNAQLCQPEPTGPQVLIAGTDWIARERGAFCGFGISAMTDIQIVTADGSIPITIAKGDDVDRVTLNGDYDHQLILFVPKNADVVPVTTIIPNLTITWRQEG